MMKLPTPMTAEEQKSALHEIGGGILAVAPAGWTELRYSLAMTAELSGIDSL